MQTLNECDRRIYISVEEFAGCSETRGPTSSMDASTPEMMSQMFCPKCRCLLFPEEGKLICRKCGNEQDSADASKPQVIRHKSRDRETAVLDELSGTLPTADVECPSCGNRKAYWVLRQTRAADEPETRIFRCVKCSHSWREY